MRKRNLDEGKSLSTPASSSKLGLSEFYFPEDLIPNILVSLPVKSLIRFTSVCKSLMSIVKNPAFIRTHLTRTLNSNDQNATHFILIHTISAGGNFSPAKRYDIFNFEEDSCSLRCDDSTLSLHSKIEFPRVLEEKLINPCFRVVCTCDGLVLLADDLAEYGYTFVICNPSVRKYVILPEPSVRFSTHDEYEASLGLGFDAVKNDYKVVRLTTFADPLEDPRVLGQVYSLGEGTWSQLHCVPKCLVLDTYSNVFVNGVLHWPALHYTDNENDIYFILTFDMATDSFGRMMLPMSYDLEDNVSLRLSVSEDRKSIALFVRWLGRTFEYEVEPFVEIWVKKEYAEEKSWTKLVVVGPQGPERRLPWAFWLKRTGEVILELDISHDLVLLDVVSHEFKHLGISEGRVCSVHSYEESLVLLDRNDAASY